MKSIEVRHPLGHNSIRSWVHLQLITLLKNDDEILLSLSLFISIMSGFFTVLILIRDSTLYSTQLRWPKTPTLW